MSARHAGLDAWVRECAALTQPDQVVWCDGSEGERDRMTRDAVRTGVLTELNQDELPGCHLHRSNPNDVARVEQCTFICTRSKDDAGPTNNWMDPKEAYAKLSDIYRGLMKGRTMYVVPYLMGPVGSPHSKVGVELTDSVYVALNMRIMTRMGNVALEALGSDGVFVKGLHSIGTLDPAKRFICHFPEDYAIWSVNSGYGGNALLGKKCFALRIASWMARQEGWLAEHMFISGIESPDGEITWVAGALPSACGKTNLAMLVPPARYKGWKVHTLGDDIAWLRFGPDGRLWAVNPEAGFFGVAPGTNYQTNPNAMKSVSKNTIFTNVVMTPKRGVWWEGMDALPSFAGCVDWTGKPWDPAGGQKGAHPNSRFTAPAKNCPSLSQKWEAPEGVPISAIMFGARRSTLVPLVYEAFQWNHGVYLGATLCSETTAAAAGAVGALRRDPMAMLPFIGYNAADYFRHWIEVGKKSDKMPRIFRINWFRKEEGRFLWPGFGENMRILKWIVDRCHGRVDAVESPIGYMPRPEDLDRDGLDVSDKDMKSLFEVDTPGWHGRLADQAKFFGQFGDRLPKELSAEAKALETRLNTMKRP